MSETMIQRVRHNAAHRVGLSVSISEALSLSAEIAAIDAARAPGEG